MGRALRYVWDWLHKHIGTDEPMLRGLRRAESIVIHHPTTMTVEEANAAWEGYLAHRQKHHVLWLIVNALLAPITGIGLMIIPGPNVVGFWFAYRALMHLFALLGVLRARGKTLPLTYEPSESLDTILTDADTRQVAEVAHECGLKRLGKLIRHHESVIQSKLNPHEMPLVRQ